MSDTTLWTELLARLWLAEVAAWQPDARRQLQELGVRHVQTVAGLLARERDHATRMAALAGQPVARPELLHRIGQLARPAPLAQHLQAVCTAYRQLQHGQAARAPGDLSQWLAERWGVHSAQVQLMAGESDAPRNRDGQRAHAAGGIRQSLPVQVLTAGW